MYGGSVTVMTGIICASNTLCIFRILGDASAVFLVQNFL